jgi:hypothetical protein
MAIPRRLCISEYYVVFANLTDSEIDCESKTRLLVRKLTTDKLRVLYAKGIDIYAKIPENVIFFAPDEREKILPHFTNDGLDSTLIREAEIPASRPSSARDGNRSANFIRVLGCIASGTRCRPSYI